MYIVNMSHGMVNTLSREKLLLQIYLDMNLCKNYLKGKEVNRKKDNLNY